MKKILQLLLAVVLATSMVSLNAFNLIKEAKNRNTQAIKEYLESFTEGQYDLLRNELKEQDFSNKTALHYAIEKGNLELVTLLLETSKRIGGLGTLIDIINNSRDSQGRSLFHCAISDGHIEIVKLLIDIGVQINSVGRPKGVLHWAVCHNYYSIKKSHVEAVKALLAAGAQAETKDSQDKTALERAQERFKESQLPYNKGSNTTQAGYLQTIIADLESNQENYVRYKKELEVLPDDLEAQRAVMNRYFYDLCLTTNALEKGKLQPVYSYYIHRNNLDEFVRLLQSAIHCFSRQSRFFTQSAGYKVPFFGGSTTMSGMRYSDLQRARSWCAEVFEEQFRPEQDRISQLLASKKLLNTNFYFK